jgi:GH25 family lysozyme M1 (1,4-beta-N-acetylmuramidase)
MKGIDVSAFQGIIDWDKVKASGVEFAMIRAGWGIGTLDKYFKRNVEECVKRGIKVGIYWFIYALNDSQASQNASACLKAIKGMKIDFPVCPDFEYDSVSYASKKGVPIDKATASRWVKIFLDSVKKAGYDTANYTNLDYYNRYFTNEVNNRYDVWFAYWGKATTMTKASAIWQYSSKGKVNGIVGNVDMDESHKAYPSVNPNPNVPDVPVNPSPDSYKIPTIYNLVFDARWYFDRYPDLQEAVKAMISNGSLKNNDADIAWWLYQHFITFGMEEADNGRYGCASFNVVKYKNAYADLRQAFGDSSWKPYYYHYMQSGAKEIAEGKRAKVDLTV